MKFRGSFCLKKTGIVDEIQGMNLTQCPYDATEITVESYEGGVYLISCPLCMAQWETHSGWVARVSEPDWDIVKTFTEIQSLASTRD